MGTNIQTTLKFLLQAETASLSAGAATGVRDLDKLDGAKMKLAGTASHLTRSVGQLGHAFAGMGGEGAHIVHGLSAVTTIFSELGTAAGGAGLAMGAAFVGLPLLIQGVVSAIEGAKKETEAVLAAAKALKELSPAEKSARDAAEEAGGKESAEMLRRARETDEAVTKLREERQKLNETAKPGMFGGVIASMMGRSEYGKAFHHDEVQESLKMEDRISQMEDQAAKLRTDAKSAAQRAKNLKGMEDFAKDVKKEEGTIDAHNRDIEKWVAGLQKAEQKAAGKAFWEESAGDMGWGGGKEGKAFAQTSSRLTPSMGGGASVGAKIDQTNQTLGGCLLALNAIQTRIGMRP